MSNFDCPSDLDKTSKVVIPLAICTTIIRISRIRVYINKGF